MGLQEGTRRMVGHSRRISSWRWVCSDRRKVTLVGLGWRATRRVRSGQSRMIRLRYGNRRASLEERFRGMRLGLRIRRVRLA